MPFANLFRHDTGNGTGTLLHHPGNAESGLAQFGQLLPEADLPLINRVIVEATEYLVRHGLVDALMRD